MASAPSQGYAVLCVVYNGERKKEIRAGERSQGAGGRALAHHDIVQVAEHLVGELAVVEVEERVLLFQDPRYEGVIRLDPLGHLAHVQVLAQDRKHRAMPLAVVPAHGGRLRGDAIEDLAFDGVRDDDFVKLVERHVDPDEGVELALHLELLHEFPNVWQRRHHADREGRVAGSVDRVEVGLGAQHLERDEQRAETGGADLARGGGLDGLEQGVDRSVAQQVLQVEVDGWKVPGCGGGQDGGDDLVVCALGRQVERRLAEAVVPGGEVGRGRLGVVEERERPSKLGGDMELGRAVEALRKRVHLCLRHSVRRIRRRLWLPLGLFCPFCLLRSAAR